MLEEVSTQCGEVSLHHTHKITDSTKAMSFMTCPRKYFYEYVLGWSSEVPNIHLIFGTAMHKGFEELLNRYQDEGHTYSESAVHTAMMAFMEEWRKEYPDPLSDLENRPKTPDNCRRMFEAYIERYNGRDNFDVHYTEVAGHVPLDTEGKRNIYFKIDAVCEDADGLFFIDHKSAGKRLNVHNAKHWNLSFQFSTYVHALRMFMGSDNVRGGFVNHCYITDPPKMKKDGTPYANSTDTEVNRITVEPSNASMANWLHDANRELTDMGYNFDALSDAKETDPILLAFPMRRTSCGNYGGCQFCDLCEVWSNPLQHKDTPPEGFKVEFWNPMEMAEAATTQVADGKIVS